MYDLYGRLTALMADRLRLPAPPGLLASSKLQGIHPCLSVTNGDRPRTDAGRRLLRLGEWCLAQTNSLSSLSSLCLGAAPTMRLFSTPSLKRISVGMLITS